MYHLPACAWRIILIHKCLVSMVWLYPPPRIQSSQPGWHCIFRLGDLQAKPSFCHCWWLDSRSDAWAFQSRPPTWCWTCLVTGSFILLPPGSGGWRHGCGNLVRTEGRSKLRFMTFVLFRIKSTWETCEVVSAFLKLRCNPSCFLSFFAANDGTASLAKGCVRGAKSL